METKFIPPSENKKNYLLLTRIGIGKNFHLDPLMLHLSLDTIAELVLDSYVNNNNIYFEGYLYCSFSPFPLGQFTSLLFFLFFGIQTQFRILRFKVLKYWMLTDFKSRGQYIFFIIWTSSVIYILIPKDYLHFFSSF